MNIEINEEIKEETNENETEKSKKIIKAIKIICAILFLIIMLITYARFKETNSLKVKEYKITNEKIPDNFHGTKIVQISDLYYGNTTNISFLKKIVKKINELKPDILILTGDLLDKEITNEEKEEIIKTLKEIQASIDCYAITGEIDKSNKKNWDEIINESGFINLDNDEKKIYKQNNQPIIITNKEVNYENIYTIYILHEPDNVEMLNNKYDLILAGHSLNGQINIPLIKKLLLKKGAKKYYKSHYIVNDTNLYISSGLGTTKFKYRFLNKPSINLYRLTNH